VLFRSLVRPFAGSVRLNWAHYVVWAEGTGDDPRIKKFRDWLMVEVADAKRVALKVAT